MEYRYDYADVTNIVWHSHKNIVSFTTSEGELYIYEDFVTAKQSAILEDALHPAPFIHDPLSETTGNARKPLTNGSKDSLPSRARRRGSLDSLDDILGPDMDLDNDDFVEDDDGAGYADGLNMNGKRTNGHLDDFDGLNGKRRPTYDSWQRRIHESFQPGSTPWRGNRRYLCKRPILGR